jgi:hypothetical protein
VLRLRDARTRELADVLPVGRRQLRILISAPGQVRAHLTADLLRRAAEMTRLLPTMTELLPAAAPGKTALRATCEALNVHPPRDTLALPVDPLTGIPLFDVGIGVVGEVPNSDVTGLARMWVHVAADSAPDGAPAGQEPGLGEEPLAVRLTLLRHRYWQPVDNNGVPPTADAETLARWRALVARWARSPSGAVSREHAEAVKAALGDDLDTVTALSALGALAADSGVPDGVKFETFAAADHLLGLDLARDIGKQAG